MNIFAPDPCPIISAQSLDDVRLRKMNIETAQLLCTALRMRYGFNDVPYKNSHIHHPLVHWLLRSSGNIRWLFHHGIALYDENRFRSGKQHKSGLVTMGLVSYIVQLPEEEMTPMPNCARNKSLGIDFTHIENLNEAYRLYLAARWPGDKRPPIWTKRGAPAWAGEFQ